MGTKWHMRFTAVVLGIVIALAFVLGMQSVSANGFGEDANGQGGGCSFSESIEQFQQNPPPCTGTIDVMVRVHWDGEPDGEDNVCL